MARATSKLAAEWWDYTTLDAELLADAAALSQEQLLGLSRDGFRICVYETLEEFYTAEALEYITAWRLATADNPAGICGPVGPTEQLPLVAQIVNALDLPLHNAHFWGMDEWVIDGKAVSIEHPLSFARADMQLCFNRIRPELRMPAANLHFPTGDLSVYSKSFEQFRCLLMQGGQGDIKHWAFNDPLPRRGAYHDAPPTVQDYLQLSARVVDLHPVTIMQNARTSGGGNVALVPTQAATVGPKETMMAEKVSIWHAGCHDNAFGMRLTTLMLAQKIIDSAVPMSLLANHHNVQFNFYRPGIGTVEVEMH